MQHAGWGHVGGRWSLGLLRVPPGVPVPQRPGSAQRDNVAASSAGCESRMTMTERIRRGAKGVGHGAGWFSVFSCESCLRDRPSDK